MSSIKHKRDSQLRLRIFAGPNGSGKSTIIQQIKDVTINGKRIDFGYYINADDIAKDLRNNALDFSQFDIELNKKQIIQFAEQSGLIDNADHLFSLEKSFVVHDNVMRLHDKTVVERLAQIIARFLRAELLRLRRRFSFETVFSHPSNLDIMQQAVEAGYRVYLYYVSTESVEINKYRVQLRVMNGGHDVPVDKIESRYIRSLNLVFNAAQFAYRVFFFDNSEEETPNSLFANFRKKNNKKEWNLVGEAHIPRWFKKYYMDKVLPK